MLRSKKAMSPLIAAVLLIVVVVGIGGVIMGIARNFVSENKQQIESKDDSMACSRDVNVDVLTVDGEPQLCKGADYVEIVLENTGKADVDDFQMSVFGDSGFYSNQSISASDPFTIGEAQQFNGYFLPSAVGVIQQVKFIPKLDKGVDYHYCAEVAVTYEAIPDC